MGKLNANQGSEEPAFRGRTHGSDAQPQRSESTPAVPAENGSPPAGGVSHTVQTVIEKIAARFHVPSAALFLFAAPDSSEIRYVTGVGLADGFARLAEELSRTASFASFVPRLADRLVVEDIGRIPLSALYRRIAADHGIVSVVTQPLQTGSKPFGFLALCDDHARSYDDEELEDLSLFTDLLALVYHDADAAMLGKAAGAIESNMGGMGRERFLNLLGHELRTPLTSIMGFTQMIRKRLGNAPSQDARLAEQLDVVWAQAQRMSRLIDTFVDLAHIEQGDFEIIMGRMELTSLLRGAVKQSVAQAGGRQHIVVDVGEDPVWIHGDKKRLEQVFNHVLSNALRYSPSERSITVSCKLRQPDGRAVIEIADRGPGIPEGLRQSLFQPYYQGAQEPASSAGGLGVGLFLSKTIIEAHGGQITIGSPPSGGTRVTMVLPM